jgi:hypothetical protein
VPAAKFVVKGDSIRQASQGSTGPERTFQLKNRCMEGHRQNGQPLDQSMRKFSITIEIVILK